MILKSISRPTITVMFGALLALNIAFAQSSDLPLPNVGDQAEKQQQADLENEERSVPARDLSIDDVFKPSEELSEDASAPFPTDI